MSILSDVRVRLALGALTLGTVCGASHAAAPTTQPIPKTVEPVTVDGELSEPVWRKSAPIPADYLYRHRGERAARPRMVARYAWDDHYLYIAYETFDRNLVAVGSGVDDGPPDNRRHGLVLRSTTQPVDVVEFFVSLGDEHFFWEIHHNALNQFNDAWNVAPDASWPITATTMMPANGVLVEPEKFIRDDGPHTLACAVKLKPKPDGSPSTVNDDRDEDTGYIAEIRLPWAGIGVPREARARDGGWDLAGRELLVLAVCQDMDEREYYTHSSPTLNSVRFATAAKDFPRYRLVAEPP